MRSGGWNAPGSGPVRVMRSRLWPLASRLSYCWRYPSLRRTSPARPRTGHTDGTKRALSFPRWPPLRPPPPKCWGFADPPVLKNASALRDQRFLKGWLMGGGSAPQGVRRVRSGRVSPPRRICSFRSPNKIFDPKLTSPKEGPPEPPALPGGRVGGFPQILKRPLLAHRLGSFKGALEFHSGQAH